MRQITEIQHDLTIAKAEENRQYWAFTRTARGKPVSPDVTRRIVRLEDELREARREQNTAPAVTSRRMVADGYDNAARSRFHAAQVKQARKIGKDEAAAVEFADMMCDMYGHHFRVWK